MTALCAGYAPVLIDLEALALFAVLMGVAVMGMYIGFRMIEAAKEMEDDE